MSCSPVIEQAHPQTSLQKLCCVKTSKGAATAARKRKMPFPVLLIKKEKALFNTFRHFNVLVFSLSVAVLFLRHRDL